MQSVVFKFCWHGEMNLCNSVGCILDLKIDGEPNKITQEDRECSKCANLQYILLFLICS